MTELRTIQAVLRHRLDDEQDCGDPKCGAQGVLDAARVVAGQLGADRIGNKARRVLLEAKAQDALRLYGVDARARLAELKAQLKILVDFISARCTGHAEYAEDSEALDALKILVGEKPFDQVKIPGLESLREI